MYRDDLEALQAQRSELTRTLEARRRQLSPRKLWPGAQLGVAAALFGLVAWVVLSLRAC